MKVLIISAYPPDPAPEANHALHLSEHLAGAGFAVHVLCKKGSIAATQQGIVVHPVIKDWTWTDVPEMARCMKSYQPDIVLLLYLGWIYNHHPMITFLPTICQTVLPGVPCVTQFEAIDERSRRQSLVMRGLRKAMAVWAGRKDVHPWFGTLLRDSARIVVLSSPHRSSLAKHYSGVDEKSVILPPPPLIRFCSDQSAVARKQARDSIGAAPSDFVLVYWGYIYPAKGVETLLRAFRIAYRQNEKLRLVLVGGNLEISWKAASCREYFEMVRQLPETLGVAERVTWTGHFNWDSDEGSRYLHAGDACVLPFDYGVTLNNSSLAAASTHGLPVISTELAVGRDEALEHGQNIYLCRPRDPEMLAEAILLISESTALRERLRTGILDLAREWHRWDIMTERLAGTLKSAITSEAASSKKKRAFDLSPRKLNDETRKGLTQDARISPSVWSAEYIRDDENRPCVSVVVAVYNVERYLAQCLDSLINQTLKNVEIIVVNDASTDNSGAILDDYKSRYPHLRVVNCESNRGLASVRNIGMKLAKGEYIAFTDGDDWADVRFCEAMYRRARADDSDVLIGDAKVFYDDSKTFRQFFDQHIRQTLDPRLRNTPFVLRAEPRVLLLEPVAWPKIYRRSFLKEHAIQFEDGMNSYEDMCFHFSVLLKAKRISLTDDAYIFYRQNRPGQISGRTSRMVFEVFAVFQKIHANLAGWNVPADIWGLLIRVQLRQFDWLLKDRVQTQHKREFLGLVAKQLQMIPESGFQKFAREANSDESFKLLCMRKNWLRPYEKVSRGRWPMLPTSYAMLFSQRRMLPRRRGQRGSGILRRRLISAFRFLVARSLNLAKFNKQLRSVDRNLNRLIGANAFNSQSEDTLVEVCRIDGQILFFSHRPLNSGLSDAVWRMANDHYLSRAAAFREGDTVIDVGAHVGVFSIGLAKRYPFITVYAIEPDPMNYVCLQRNIELNDVTNVIAINKAVSGDAQRSTLYIDPWDSRWATLDPVMALTRRYLQTVPVETVTLEDIFSEYDISHCRLLKMTALGAVRGSLQEFTRSGCVDLLCGEADLEDCSQVALEMASWRIARQHFWRTVARNPTGTVYSWIQQVPRLSSDQAHLPSFKSLGEADGALRSQAQ
jgi:FkbM family methyltransferase